MMTMTEYRRGVAEVALGQWREDRRLVTLRREAWAAAQRERLEHLAHVVRRNGGD